MLNWSENYIITTARKNAALKINNTKRCIYQGDYDKK